ncbi:MAG: hypothetical protein HY906_22935 [Deltaproteobacteria bacterium]|nr:hypothetical protein [Deltaproteobacteria bacterium]
MLRMRHMALALSSTFIFVAVARAATGDVILSVDSSFPSPDGLMWDGQYLWATDCSTSRIDKVDPRTGQVVGSIDVTGVNSDELAWDGDAMWVSDHTATEMPGMGAPPPRLYRVDPETATVLASFDAPGASKYPMGMACDGESLWNLDPWDRKIFQLDPATGATKRSIPAPAMGACGLTFDGACLWVTDAATDGRVYHVDPASGEVLSSFDGPGGPGHQTTGVAWDGRDLWLHDEATGRAKIHKVRVEDITEAGRCAGAFQVGLDGGVPAPDGGRRAADGGPGTGGQAGADAAGGGCSLGDEATVWPAMALGLLLAGLLVATVRRGRGR